MRKKIERVVLGIKPLIFEMYVCMFWRFQQESFWKDLIYCVLLKNIDLQRLIAIFCTVRLNTFVTVTTIFT